MSQNPAYVTAAKGRVYHVSEAIRADWADGKEFRLYGGQIIDKRAEPRLRAAGFTHIFFIYQDKDNKVHHHSLELK